MTTPVSVSATRHPLSLQWWPLLLGLVAALGIGLGLGRGLAAIVMVCALIYLFAAVTDRPGFAWLGFLVTSPVIAVGAVLRVEGLSLIIIGGLALVLVVVGFGRGTWRTSINRWQIAAATVFSAVAVTAYLAAPFSAALLIAAGLVAHAIWDIVHHIRRAVVSQPYAEFCAALDLGLAAVLLLVIR